MGSLADLFSAIWKNHYLNRSVSEFLILFVLAATLLNPSPGPFVGHFVQLEGTESSRLMD